MDERPQLDLPTRPSSNGLWLIVLAWALSIISLIYSGLYGLGLAMSPGSPRLSAYDAMAINSWPVLVGIAIALFFKHHAATKGRAIAILVPGLLCLTSLPFCLMSLTKSPVIVILIWGLPVAAGVVELWCRTRDKAAYALEFVLAVLLISIPVRVATTGLDFGGTKAQMAKEASAYKTRINNEAIFASFTTSLKKAIPNNPGRWQMVMVKAPGDRMDDLTLAEQVIHGPRERGPLTNGIWALYEEMGLGPAEGPASKEQQGNRTKELAEQIKAYEMEYESIKGHDLPNDWSRGRRDRQDFLRDTIGALRRQFEWNADQWDFFEKMKKRVLVRIELNLPNDKIASYGATWAEFATIDPASLVVIPWTDHGARELLDKAYRKDCLLGESNQSEQMRTRILNRTYSQEPFMLKSLGVNITVTASDAQKVDEFIKALDLAPFRELIKKTPPGNIIGSRS